MSNPIENSVEFERGVAAARSLKIGLGDVAIVRGQTMRDLVEHLQIAEDQGAYEMHFAIDGGLKVKINNQTWSVPLGTVEK